MEELREIVREHLWRHNSRPGDGQGRPYGWTNEEIDALIIALTEREN